ncbi:unnamed protein product [Angiostrongylus costaricensis]|uniref:Carboxypeptidase regulatory-like domain-containing protein n=1 Tax=Angiostrongylus costaricensis TaxID=334426 RepID=A0A158PK06_ANGCS|nr:unnamed protein product [Angiostrongylus costaricensis]
MIPVYSKGHYSLKVFAPEGWYFEPEVVDFDLDGVNDPCTQNRDINFFLTGFSIHGVVGDVSGSGPTGLSLILKQDGKVIDSTTTTEGGKYLFKAVAGLTPYILLFEQLYESFGASGKYEVSTGIDSSVCIRHGKTFVEVTNAPVLVKPGLRIAGYTFTVAVRNKDQPLPNARITLYSKRHLELENCNAVISPVRGMDDAEFVCNVGVTKDDGIISVPCLPNGIYYVNAEYKTDEADFLFSPAIQKLVVENEAVKVSFSVTGFTARGRVVVSKKGVSGAQVVVQGKEVTETDANGYFTLQGLTEGTLDITARAPHMKFSTERNVLVLPSIKIRDVNVESFEVCGSVEISSQDAIVSTLILKKTDGAEIVSIRPAADGKFCKMVAPGKYSISPADFSSTLTPRSLDIDVTTSYVSDLRFTHFKTDAVVLVTCIGTCETLSISLLQGTNELHTVRGKDEFVFKNIGPGAYRVRINEGDRACWEKRELPLFIDKVRPQPVHFVQSGFTSIIKLSHPAHMKWSHNEKKQLRGDTNAAAGLSSICVPVQGRYNVQLISCMNFDPPHFNITVTSDSIYESKAIDARISGSINSTDGKGFIIKVKSSLGERDVSIAANGLFSFYEPLTSVSDIVIKPHSATHLFDPPDFIVHFRGNCEENVVQFFATKGIFIDGSITPAISGVKVGLVNISY